MNTTLHYAPKNHTDHRRGYNGSSCESELKIMFELDKWQEIYSTVRKNKLRTFLTGFSVAWGIFMLIILLGSGSGLENGVHEQFKGGAMNGVWISSGVTSMQYKGLKTGRNIKFTNEDYYAVKQAVPEADHISARLFLGNRLISYKKSMAPTSSLLVIPIMVTLKRST